MTNTKTIKRRACAIFLLALILVELLLGLFGIRASAATSYSGVMEDLTSDSGFKIESYPADDKRTDIQVIHIAESVEGQLYVYTYQPGNEVKHRKANYINMSLQNPTTDTKLTYKKYSLTWLNGDGVFDKYLVNGFAVTDSTERYYNIAAIYRLYDENVDTSSSSEVIDTVQCKSFSVGQYWRTYYYNDVLMYESNRIDVVEYEVYDTGTIRYQDGFDPKAPYQSSFADSHYVVVNITNYDVDRIIDADISYKLVQYEDEHLNYPGQEDSGPKKINEKEEPGKYLSALETGSNTPSGWFAKEYTWQRILPAEDFKKISEDNANEKFSDDEVKALQGPDLKNPYKNMFVFAFAETTWKRDHYNDEYGGFCDTYWTTEKFGILRLHFVSSNKTYNLGAVGDLVGTDSNPEMVVDGIDNIKNTLEDAQEWLEFIVRIVGIILLVVLLSFIARPVGFVFKIIWTGVTFVLKVVFNIITLPFRLIFGRRRY